MQQKWHGIAHVFGDHVDTDLIIPSCHLITGDEKELGKHAFAIERPDFAQNVQLGDVLVAGRNFGCGSSREHAPLAIRGAGISCIFAESFARTFYRNCINRGFPAIELKEATRHIHQGDKLFVDLEQAKVVNETTGESVAFSPVPDFVLDMWKLGGLFGYIQKELNNSERKP
ncbi:MAG TPA: 3-isopropylmalate dehydratase small subunit [Candidatus Gallacutalibacter pullistercoris]|nr:3-isopropylmalate dehydratase small subunit [Candidatus Gallacutalibacter pullistercoris]